MQVRRRQRIDRLLLAVLSTNEKSRTLVFGRSRMAICSGESLFPGRMNLNRPRDFPHAPTSSLHHAMNLGLLGL